MIAASYDRERGLFEVRGHAGFGKCGVDIVCAAASMLVYTLADALGLQDEDCFSSGGDCRIELREHSEALDFTASGFRLLARNYPRHVTFKEVRK